jgi:hypothetical protein
MSKVLNIKKFNMQWIGNNKVILFIGKRNTGKSSLVLEYLYYHQDIPIATIISPTDEFNNVYAPHIPCIFIHEQYSSELVDQYLKRQMKISKNVRTDPSYKNVDPRGILILDDCLYDAKNWLNDTNIKWIFFNGRHANTSFILTMQYCMGITPNLRTNVDYVFICKESKLSIQKRLYEHYCGIFPTFELFRQTLCECTKNYGCLVIDNSSTSDKLLDQVFWYQANPEVFESNFRVCYDDFWKNNEQLKNNKHDYDNDEPEEFNMDDAYSKKNKQNFTISKR